MTEGGPARIAVFGLGVVGGLLARALAGEGAEVYGFSRNRCAGQGSIFDASNATECQQVLGSLPPMDSLFVTFPPQNVHPSFFDLTRNLCRNRFLLGSTSIYDRRHPGERIHEGSELRTSHQRYDLENRFLRSGGTVVRLAGIYGPHRNPLNWIRDGRVGYENRQVNLVHHDDITCCLCLLAGTTWRAPVYNLADGQAHTWKSIFDFLQRKGWLQQAPAPSPPRRPHSFVENRLFRSHFSSFSFRNFWQELDGLVAELS